MGKATQVWILLIVLAGTPLAASPQETIRGSDFASKYEALLRRGFDAETQVLLGSLNIRPDDSGLVKASARLIRSEMEKLRSLYQVEAAPAK
jgi:hypothetical protein